MPSRFACSRNGFKTAAHDGSALLLRGTTLIPRTVTRCALLASSKAATCNGVSRPALLASSGRRLRGQYPRGSPRRLAPAAGSLSGGGAASCSHPRLLLMRYYTQGGGGCQAPLCPTPFKKSAAMLQLRRFLQRCVNAVLMVCCNLSGKSG